MRRRTRRRKPRRQGVHSLRLSTVAPFLLGGLFLLGALEASCRHPVDDSTSATSEAVISEAVISEGLSPLAPSSSGDPRDADRQPQQEEPDGSPAGSADTPAPSAAGPALGALEGRRLERASAEDAPRGEPGTLPLACSIRVPHGARHLAATEPLGGGSRRPRVRPPARAPPASFLI
ncbi:MAG: hypothetical protein O7J95_15225 [Planctomycetota bacterium]|nr:hypothetical protein [Planctomycetota bacterium]